MLCPADRVQAFVDEFRARFAEMYPSLRDNDDYTAIINERQYNRLQGYLEDARAKGGAELVEINPANENMKDGTRKIPLTLVLKTTPDMKVMQDEIFGPILPVISYGSLDEAIHYINDRPRPLALYFFGYDKSHQQHVVDNTHSGGMCINDALMHVAQDDLPFGGIGDSGMGGHYHGKEGFLTFSHHRAIFTKQKFNSGKYVYAPPMAPQRIGWCISCLFADKTRLPAWLGARPRCRMSLQDTPLIRPCRLEQNIPVLHSPGETPCTLATRRSSKPEQNNKRQRSFYNDKPTRYEEFLSVGC